MALPRLFPRLRTSGLQTKDLAPAGAEQKVILSSYYAALAGSGIALRGQDRGRGWAVERAVAEGYERVVWCFKPVQVISGNSAALPFVLKQGDNEVTDHPLYQVLNKQANPLESATVFRKRLSAQVLLSRRGAFVEVTKSNGGSISRVDLLPPGRTRPVPGTGSDPISHFEVTALGNGTKREVDVEKVRWIRDPHPIDPYGAITPLEAAGLSIELDYFARLYNVSFMANDGRPGGILGVKPPENGGGEMDAEEMDRLEARFGRGPVEAGKLSVLSGELSYVDVAARPRDMQYQETSKNAKTEMLVAFGVPESQLGNAADRTFANAEEEGYSFWTQTMEMHNSIILSGFEQDSDDDLTGYFDTSKIEVLQRPAIARRAEAREEVAAGLRSIFSYMSLAGTEDEVEETPFTRALWLPAGKTPIPAREEDAEALGVGAEVPPEEGLAPEGDPNAAPAAPGEEIAPPGAAPVDPAAPVASTGAASAPTPVSGPANRSGAPAPRSPSGGLSLFGDATFAGHPRRQVHLAAVREHKAAPADDLESALDESLAEETEAAVAEALAAITERQVERAIARLKSPRERKGTRHFVAEFEIDTRVGNKALDAPRIAGEGDEPDGETDAVRRILERAAGTSAAGLLTDLTGKAGALPGTLLRRVKTTVGEAMRLVNDSVRLQRQRIADTINRLDQAGKSVEEIVAALRALQDNWSEGLAIQATTASLEGARADAADTLTEEEQADILRVWRSKRDVKVRVTHQKASPSNPGGADGQARKMGEPFIVGNSLMRYPGDPSAPPSERINCRCRLVYRSKSTGRFRANPAGEITRRPAEGKVRHVRTAAGVAHYGQPIGSVIEVDAPIADRENEASELPDIGSLSPSIDAAALNVLADAADDWRYSGKSIKAVESWATTAFAEIRESFHDGSPGALAQRFVTQIATAPAVRAMLYRGVESRGLSIEESAAQWQGKVGETFAWDAPTSTSLRPDVAATFGAIVFEIEDGRGHYVGIGERAGEQEVVTLPGERFTVTGVARARSRRVNTAIAHGLDGGAVGEEREVLVVQVRQEAGDG